MLKLGEMSLFFFLNASEWIDKTSTKNFLGIFILPQRTRKTDEMRFGAAFLILYIIYQTESITLHAYVDSNGLYRHSSAVSQWWLLPWGLIWLPNDLQTVAKHYKREGSAVCMTRAGNGLCKEANGTDTQSFQRASLSCTITAGIRKSPILQPQISMAEFGILDSLAIFNLAI